MPRKYVRKLLPSHQAVRDHRYIGVLGPAFHHPNLWHLNRRSVAGGVAIGMLCGMIPLPIQMVFATIFAVVLRANLPVALATTWYVNPFTIVPLYYLAYKVGALITEQAPPTTVPPVVTLSISNVRDWIPLLLGWIDEMGKPFAVGLSTLGVILSIGSYFAVRGVWRLYIVMAWRRRAKSRES